MQDKQSVLTATLDPIAKLKDYLHQLVHAVEVISALERVRLQLPQIQRLVVYVRKDSTVQLVLHSQEIAHLAHIAVLHNCQQFLVNVQLATIANQRRLNSCQLISILMEEQSATQVITAHLVLQYKSLVQLEHIILLKENLQLLIAYNAQLGHTVKAVA